MEGVCLIAKKGTKKNKKDNTPLQKSLDIEKQVSKNMKLDFLEKIKLLEMPLNFPLAFTQTNRNMYCEAAFGGFFIFKVHVFGCVPHGANHSVK